MNKAQQKSKTTKALCDEIQAKYGDNQAAKKKTEQMKSGIKDKEKELERALDQKIEKSI